MTLLQVDRRIASYKVVLIWFMVIFMVTAMSLLTTLCMTKCGGPSTRKGTKLIQFVLV